MEDCGESTSQQSWNVLQDDVFGSNIANSSKGFMPQSCAWMVDRTPAAPDRHVLTRETSRYHVGRQRGYCSYVVIDRHIRPVFRENTLTVWVHLAEGYGGELARPLETEREPTNAGE